MGEEYLDYHKGPLWGSEAAFSSLAKPTSDPETQLTLLPRTETRLCIKLYETAFEISEGIVEIS